MRYPPTSFQLSWSLAWATDTELGYVPQKLDIERDLPLNGHDVLGAKAALVGCAGTMQAEALRSVGLDEEVLATPIGNMSGGQFQRLLIAFALLGRPNVLLLDEPAAGIDAPGQAQLNEVIHGLQDSRAMTVLLVSHDLSVVYRYADNVLCLGRTGACFGPPRSALTVVIERRVDRLAIGDARQDSARPEARPDGEHRADQDGYQQRTHRAALSERSH